MDKVYLIILGWALGIFSMLISNWLQTKKENRKKEIDIISENLKYLFNTGQIYNNFLTDKLVYEKMSNEYPEKSSELERKMYENFDMSIKEDFFPQLMFQSFQLKRLKDKSFWKEFEEIMNNYELLGNAIHAQESEEKINTIKAKILDLTKQYATKCHAKADT
jgi:hypothetical protein